MLPVLTPAEMRAADARAIAEGISQDTLMARAGAAVAWSVRREVGSLYGVRVVALCGKGSNGGDGRLAASTLERWGARVARFEVDEPLDLARLDREMARAQIVVDAMYGTGFRGELTGDPAWAATAASDSGAEVVAVDIPSGVDGATGAIEGIAVSASRTVALAALKAGLVCGPGRSHAGVLEVADIGIDPGPAALALTEPTDVAAWLPPRSPEANKWSVGGVFVVGGAEGMFGAPMLVSQAALRAGAGIVWCGVPGTGATVASGSEVITKALPSSHGSLAAEAGPAVAEASQRFRAIVVGPGLGTAPTTSGAVRAILAATPGAVVLDADGLNALAGDLAPLRERAGRPTILTPHGGEYARLAGRAVGDDRVAAARDLAVRSGCVVVLKGPGTVVARPDGRAVVNPTGSAALATAGSGDVLAGIVGALAARGMPAFQAAVAGVYLHGAAAELLPSCGLVASDLIGVLPGILARVDGDPAATLGSGLPFPEVAG